MSPPSCENVIAHHAQRRTLATGPAAAPCTGRAARTRPAYSPVYRFRADKSMGKWPLIRARYDARKYVVWHIFRQAQ